MLKPKESELSLAGAIFALAEQFRRYNDANEPVQITVRSEAEVFKATYERDDPEKRELHDYLTGKDSAVPVGRPSGQPNRSRKKATGRNRRDDGGGS